jgi:hypothetical protein
MDGLAWLFLAQFVATVLLTPVVVGLRCRPSGVKKSTQPPHCETPMLLRRLSDIQWLRFKGMWISPHSGTKFSRKRESREAAT